MRDKGHGQKIRDCLGRLRTVGTYASSESQGQMQNRNSFHHLQPTSLPSVKQVFWTGAGGCKSICGPLRIGDTGGISGADTSCWGLVLLLEIAYTSHNACLVHKYLAAREIAFPFCVCKVCVCVCVHKCVHLSMLILVLLARPSRVQ